MVFRFSLTVACLILVFCLPASAFSEDLIHYNAKGTVLEFDHSGVLLSSISMANKGNPDFIQGRWQEGVHQVANITTRKKNLNLLINDYKGSSIKKILLGKKKIN